jgi:hypothetical protein
MLHIHRPVNEEFLAVIGAFGGFDPYGSDTYHLWLMVDYCDYVRITADLQWASQYWNHIVKGINAVNTYINQSNGLYNGVHTVDWGRNGQGGQNIALNAIFYRALNSLAAIAALMNASSYAANWTSMASRVKTSCNELLYDGNVGLYRDNTNANSIYPQDGNSFAVQFNLTASSEQARNITHALSTRWNQYGAVSQELPNTISPFVTSHELYAHFIADQSNSTLPLSLIRNQWGYMLHTFSNSSTIEGYGADGTLQYAFYGNSQASASVISHAHGWSSGPTSAMLFFIVGLQPDFIGLSTLQPIVSNDTWLFQPQVMDTDLQFAEGAFQTGRGLYQASWSIINSTAQAQAQAASVSVFYANISTPLSSSGTLSLPLFGADLTRGNVTVFMDGSQMQSPAASSSQPGFIQFPGISGGNHSVQVSFQ